jgi:hypothetical protein
MTPPTTNNTERMVFIGTYINQLAILQSYLHPTTGGTNTTYALSPFRLGCFTAALIRFRLIHNNSRWNIFLPVKR